MDLGLKTTTAQDIVNEVRRARGKFPANEHLLAALMEEVGELAQAMINQSFAFTDPKQNVSDHPNENIYKEAIQVACVAIRIAEEGDPSFPYPIREG